MALLHIPSPQTPPSSLQNVLLKNHSSGCPCQFLKCGLPNFWNASEIFRFLPAAFMLGHSMGSPLHFQPGLICFAEHFLSHVPLKVSGPVQDMQRFLPTQNSLDIFLILRCGSSLNLNLNSFLIRAELLENQIYLQEKP